MKTMSKYIPIYKYKEIHNTSMQNVYRWIREGKFKPEDIITEKVTVERIRIREDALPINRKFKSV